MSKVRVKALKYWEPRPRTGRAEEEPIPDFGLPFRVFPGDYLRIDQDKLTDLIEQGYVRQLHEREFSSPRNRMFKTGFTRE